MAKPPYPGLVIVPPSDRSILRRRLVRLASLIIAATTAGALAITDWSSNKPNCQIAVADGDVADFREECDQPGSSITEAQPDQRESTEIEVADRTMARPDGEGSSKNTTTSDQHPDIRLAQQGDAFAQYRMGRFFARQGEPHARESANWYRRAADGLRRLAAAGNGEAMYVLGVMNAFGRGVAKDDEQARRWLTRAIQHQVEAARPVLASLEKRQDAEPSLEARLHVQSVTQVERVERFRHDN